MALERDFEESRPRQTSLTGLMGGEGGCCRTPHCRAGLGWSAGYCRGGDGDGDP